MPNILFLPLPVPVNRYQKHKLEKVFVCFMHNSQEVETIQISIRKKEFHMNLYKKAQ